MAEAPVDRSTFAGGEAAPTLHARAELARFQISLAACENMVVLYEGALTRRPGTRMVMPLKTESETGALVPFRYDGANAYMLVLNGGKARVVKNGGFVLSGLTPYEFDIPWAAADLANLRHAPWGGAIYATCKGFQTRTITYAGDAAWTVALYDTFGGPSDLQNLDVAQTIIASAMTGTTTLTASAPRFSSPGDVGAVWRLDEADFSKTPIWVAGETINLPLVTIPGSTGNFGSFSSPGNAFDGNPATFASASAAALQYVGLVYGAPVTVQSATVTVNLSGSSGGICSIALYARNGAPANATDGTQLNPWVQLSIAGAVTYVLNDNDTVSTYDHIWVAYDARLNPGLTIQADEIVIQQYSTGGPILRRWQNNVYQAISNGSSGTNPPTHTTGDVFVAPGGLIFRYRHNGRGVAKVTSVTDSQHAVATVLDRIPDSVTASGTYRWFPPAWSGNVGWPEQVAFFQRRAMFFRGRKFWGSRINAPADHTPFDSGVGTADAAISGELTTRTGNVAEIRWAVGAGILVAGANDGEWMIRTLDNTQALTATNLDADEDGEEGSCPHIPARVAGGVLFLGKSRRKLHFVGVDRLATALTPEEVTQFARHVLAGRGAWLAWQKDPNRVLWIGCLDGSLVGMTWMPKQQVVALHKHPLRNGFVEYAAAISISDDAITEVYLIVRRVINGATHRFVERLQEFFPIDTVQTDGSAGWFLDCALQYVGAPTLTITGLGHLEGETVGVFVDGAGHPDCVVTGGAITLQRKGSNVLVGYRIDWRVKSLPVDLASAQSTTKGSLKTARYLVVDMLNSAGGRIAVNRGKPERLHNTGAKPPGTPVPLQTGPFSETTLGEEDLTLQWEITGSDPLPFTLRAVTVFADVEGE